MLPEIYDDSLVADYEEKKMPSKTFGLNTERKTIEGFVDDIQAVTQAILLILNTERFDSIAYSWDYGLETVDLHDSDYSLACIKIKENVIEALMQDDRVEAVNGFDFERGRGWVKAAFHVETVYGAVDIEKTFE